MRPKLRPEPGGPPPPRICMRWPLKASAFAGSNGVTSAWSGVSVAVIGFLHSVDDLIVGPAGSSAHPWDHGALGSVSACWPGSRSRPTSHQGATADYLARWRMDLAAMRLRDTAGAVARSLGYTSGYAFNRALTK